MGHKKRAADRGATAAATATATATDPPSTPRKGSDLKPLSSPGADDTAAIRAECERALTAVRRGNSTKALKLMKESLSRHGDGSSALLHRAAGAVHARVAAQLDDPTAKLRHIRAAVAEAYRAAELAPRSIELAAFHAGMLFEAANDSRGYEEVMGACERAIAIEDPDDPVIHSLAAAEDGDARGASKEVRVSQVHAELRGLMQKANLASISTWVKTLNGVTGNGEEKFRLVPVRPLADNPMELRLVPANAATATPPPRRPNEIKKATKTPEERRREIEVRITAARLLQQQQQNLVIQSSTSPTGGGNPDSPPVPTPSSGHRNERRKAAARKVGSPLEARMNQLRTFWNSMDVESRLGFLAVGVSKLKEHSAQHKDVLASAPEILADAISFYETNGVWEFWPCCCCSDKFADTKSQVQHTACEHIGNLSSKHRSVLPQEVDAEWATMLLEEGNWKPIDTAAVMKMMEEQARRVIKENDGSDGGSQDKDSLSDFWSSGDKSSDNSDSSSSAQEERREHDTADGIDAGVKEVHDGATMVPARQWPTSTDVERTKLLERVQTGFQLLLRHKCLGECHLSKVVQFALDELKSLPSGSLLLGQRLDGSPICIRFLDAGQLRKVLKFLQDLAQCCGLGRYPEREGATSDPDDMLKKSTVVEKLALDDGASKLVLDPGFLAGNNASVESANLNNDVDMDALFSWLCAGPSIGEQLAAWNRTREEKSNQAMELLQALKKEFSHLQSLCERKCEHLNYEEGLHVVENLCLEELQRRDQTGKFLCLGYDEVLRKRQEEIIDREGNDFLFSSKLELEAISSVLKDADSLNMTPPGNEDNLSDATSQLAELRVGDEDDWRMNEFVHPRDTFITLAIQRQKDQLSMELNKIDARIMRNVSAMQQLERQLGSVSAFDYRTVVLPLMKSVLRMQLEDMVDKDAKEKSDAAREAFLAELDLDAKKNASKGSDQKQVNDKSKEKKKTKDSRKIKDPKATYWTGRVDQQDELEYGHETSDGGFSIQKERADNDSELQEEDLRMLLEAEERKLEETLEYQRRIEEEAKNKHLAELSKNASENFDFNSNGHQKAVGNDSINQNNASISPVFPEGIDFGDFHVSEALVQKEQLQLSGSMGYDKNARAVMQEMQPLSLNNESRGSLQLNEINRNVSNEQPYGGSNLQRRKKTNSQPHMKHKQGTSIAILESDLSSCQPNENAPRKQDITNSVCESDGQNQLDLQNVSKKQHAVTTLEPSVISSGILGNVADVKASPILGNEEDDERFQADLKKAVLESLDGYSASTNNAVVTLNERDIYGTGLKNAVGEYNCFLNVIIQSLWHLRRFRDDFHRTVSLHMHVEDPCAVCALWDIFTDLSNANQNSEAVSPNSLRIALSKSYPDNKFFQEGQMNDASEVLEVIFKCLHKSYTRDESDHNSTLGSWDCQSSSCLAHSLFGMDINEQLNCHSCGLESRHLKYSTFFHNINASSLRAAKAICADSAFEELLKIVVMNDQLACDTEVGGCGKPNYLHHILSNPPLVFTIVLGWQNTNERPEDISATLDCITTEIDISVLYRGIQNGSKYSLISVVCYYGQHYHCFAFEDEQWVMYDDQTVKVIGSWNEVRAMCEKGHLQPQVLLFEAVHLLQSTMTSSPTNTKPSLRECGFY